MWREMLTKENGEQAKRQMKWKERDGEREIQKELLK